MIRFYRSVALFFSVLLVFTSINSGSLPLLSDTDLKIPGEKPIVSYSINSGSGFIAFNNLGEKSLSPVKGIPESVSKYQPYDFVRDSVYYGIRKYISSSRNISFSTSVECSLSGCEIVYPFHYFL